LLAIVFVLLGASACSTRFLYEKLDWFVVWKIGSYVTLQDDQKAELKTGVHDHLEYVRRNDMPRIAEVLRQTSLEVESGYVTAEMIDARYSEMLALFDEFMLGIVPISVKFLRSLDEEQVAELFENLEEINQEMYEEYSGRTQEERKKNRNESSVKGIQRFTGKLSDVQRQLITDSLAGMGDASEQWIEYQREWQDSFRLLVETRPPEDEYRAELTRLFVYPRNFHTPEYRATVDTNRLIFNQMMAELISGLTDAQRQRMVKKLAGWVDDLIKLSKDT
jgi:hypothetical protein